MSGRLDYWRADTMWAATGRPDGELGKESLSLELGQKRVFSTDWRYEKQRNDGTNYYGSHGRRLTNSGNDTIDVRIIGGKPMVLASFLLSAITGGYVLRLPPGKTVDVKNDIAEVSVPAKA